MGATCSTKETVLSDERSNMDRQRQTLIGIESLEVFDFYDVGCGIRSIAHSVFSFRRDESAESKQHVMEVSNKHKNPFYTLSTVAHVCMADGILHDKEKAFIEQYAISRGVPENDIEELLKGKDYTQEMIDSRGAVYDENHGKSTDKKSKEKAVEGFKKYFILLSILAATQDGLVRDEYEQSVKIAQKIGLTRQDVKIMVELVRTEFAMAKQLKLYLNP